jgi:thiamine kinase-like enzyme
MITIEEVVALVPEWRGKVTLIEALPGGITNRNFRVAVNGSCFFVSMSGHASQLLGVDWHNKYCNAKICGEAGVSPRVVRYFPLQRVLVLEYLPFTLCSIESLQYLDIQHRLVRMIKALHRVDSFCQDIDMFRLIQFYRATVKEQGFALPGEYTDYREQIRVIGEALAPYREDLVPCHNDLVPENMIDDGDQIFLLDFDYSGNNDPCFDLGSISVEAGYDDTQVEELARAYCGLVSGGIVGRIHLHSILGDIGWSLWSVIQAEISDIDFDFQEYGWKRWNRAVNKMESNEFDIWLRNVRLEGE